jgi:uncharacterized protein YcaQ
VSDRPLISRDVARRFLAHHHLLAPPRSVVGGPDGVMRVFDRLGSIQFDPLDIAGRNHDLVLLSRVAGYRREWTDGLLYERRELYETANKMLSIVPTAELPWYRVAWDRGRADHDGGTFDEHAPLVEELLERIRTDGPLSSTDWEPRPAIDWSWRPTNQVRAILEALGDAGILGIAGRIGNRRLYDLVERLFPAELLRRKVPPREQFRHKLLSRYRAHGLLGWTGSYELWAGTSPWKALGIEDGVALKTAGRRALQTELEESGEIVRVTIDGVRGDRFVVASELPLLERASDEVERGIEPGGVAPGVAFIAPLDPLVWDREFVRQAYDFDYLWEVYVPGPRRRWGYYVLPILYGDRLVGRIEPRNERASATLNVVDVWWEAGFDPLADERFVLAFTSALDAHRRFVDASRVTFPRTARLRDVVLAVRSRADFPVVTAAARRTGAPRARSKVATAEVAPRDEPEALSA